MWNADNKVLGSKRSDLCDCRTVFFKLNDLHFFASVYLQHEKGDGTPYRRVPSEKSTGTVADAVANVILSADVNCVPSHSLSRIPGFLPISLTLVTAIYLRCLYVSFSVYFEFSVTDNGKY